MNKRANFKAGFDFGGTYEAATKAIERVRGIISKKPYSALSEGEKKKLDIAELEMKTAMIDIKRGLKLMELMKEEDGIKVGQ